ESIHATALTESPPLDATRQPAASTSDSNDSDSKPDHRPDSTPHFDPGIIDEAITDYLGLPIINDVNEIINDLAPDNFTQSHPANELSHPEPTPSHLQPATRNIEPPGTQDSRLQTPDSPPNLQPSTFNLQQRSNLQPNGAALEAFFLKYSGIDR